MTRNSKTEGVSKTESVEPDVQTVKRRAVFTRVILPHEGDLARSARRLCGGDEDRAQDLVQDALVRAYRACLSGRFRENVNPWAWLLRIMTNLYINDYHRRCRWEARTDINSPTVCKKMMEASRWAAPADMPGVALLAGTLNEDLEQALMLLPEILRRCVVLVDLDGHEYAEAARILGIPVGTVRSRLSRAHGKLFRLLEDYAGNQRILTQPRIKAVPDQSQLLTEAGTAPFLQRVSCETYLVIQN